MFCTRFIYENKRKNFYFKGFLTKDVSAQKRFRIN